MPGLGALPRDVLGVLRVIDPREIPGNTRLATAALRGVVRARLTPPVSPVRNAHLVRVLRQWGTTPALGWSTGSARHPDAPAVIDADDADVPLVTFREAERRTAAITTGLVEAGIGAGTSVGLLGRNSRAYAEAIAATSRAGADLIYLNTGFTGPQIATIAAREGIRWVLCDADLAGLVPVGVSAIILGGPGTVKRGALRLTDLAAGVPCSPPDLPRPSRHIILTSGTTGTPRGVARDGAPLDAAIALVDALPFRQRETHVLAAPLFHAWGWLNHRICPVYDATQVLVRRPDGERVLRLAAEHAASVIVATPVVLTRMLEVPESVRAGLDLAALRVVAVSGSLIPRDQAVAFSAAFGDVLYNLYGSTEAAFATCATPADLRAPLPNVGRPLPGVRIEVRDDGGARSPTGVPGMVWVGSRTSFSGYTDGTDRARRRGLVSTGDIGTWDKTGRLRILGRADDVIISGGENVHPSEAEAVLRRHPDVADVAVVGAPDSVFGQIVVAHVVRRPAKPADLRTGRREVAEKEWESGFLAWAAERLAPYQRPRQVVLHHEIPRNETGKPLRRLLTDPQQADGTAAPSAPG